jgi:hypothetical protein
MLANVFKVCVASLSRIDPTEQWHILEDCNINFGLVTIPQVITEYRLSGEKEH